jgi:hypothetical protein
MKKFVHAWLKLLRRLAAESSHFRQRSLKARLIVRRAVQLFSTALTHAQPRRNCGHIRLIFPAAAKGQLHATVLAFPLVRRSNTKKAQQLANQPRFGLGIQSPFGKNTNVHHLLNGKTLQPRHHGHLTLCCFQHCHTLTVLRLAREPEPHRCTQYILQTDGRVFGQRNFGLDQLVDVLGCIPKPVRQLLLRPSTLLQQVKNGVPRRRHPIRREWRVGTLHRQFSHGSPRCIQCTRWSQQTS